MQTEGKKYSLINTFIYSLKTATKSDRFFAVHMIICSLMTALSTLLGVIFPKVVLDQIETQDSIKEFVWIVVAFCVLMIVANMIQQILTNTLEPKYTKIGINLTNHVLEKTFGTDYENLENPEFWNYRGRASSVAYGWSSIQGILRRSNMIIIQFTLAFSSAVAILVLNPLVVIALFVLSYASYKILDNTMKEDKKKHNDVMQPVYRKINYMDDISKNFGYAKDIRLFGMFGWFSFIYEDLNKKLFKNHTEHHNRWIFCDLRMNLLVLIQMVILYAWLVYMMFARGMSIGNFTLYVGLVNTFTSNITGLFFMMSFVHKNKLEFDDYRTFMEWKEKDQSGTIKAIDLGEYEFIFENVSFKYPGQDTYALKNVNLTIRKGMKLAIVGINGAGKTTFTKLLMRLYEPTEGRILLNGTDIRKYDRQKYFNIFAPVFQNVETFAFPIWKNVSLKTEKETNKEEVASALKGSGLDAKVDKFSKGMETEVQKIFHEDGINFSGGEKQRLGMARSLYRKAKVIVLDEPTAALDALAENRMYQEFNNMVQGKTSIFISHRLSSTRFCDEIIMFENGGIVERGTHEELIANAGRYANMYDLQSQYYKEGESHE